MAQLSPNKSMGKPIVPSKSAQVLGITVEIGTNLATCIAKNIIEKTIKRAMDTVIGF